ncbi:TPA: tail fiber domain-containing protein [Klebsiella pneumoniae]|nr:tail fiber domain-containing protein [Klebsiella pneumoniae]HDK5583179.1 tail fiber domain-containing protein [Klebsiella pneumoniae]HDK5831250.1 tail fiber domain-containing protein [Klebsiella pneumoniae]
MYHLDNTSGVPEMPEPKDTQSISPRWFGESQEQGGISWPGADWFNIVQAELLAILELVGEAPDKTRYDQIAQAIKSFSGGQTDSVWETLRRSGASKNGTIQGGTLQDSVYWVTLTGDGGAVADYDRTTQTGTDCFDAFKKCVAIGMEQGRKELRIPSGDFYLRLTDLKQDINLGGDGAVGVDGMLIQGAGKERTTLWVDADNEENILFSLRGGSGSVSYKGIRGLTIRCVPRNLYKGIFAWFENICFSVIDDFHFIRAHIGVAYVNSDADGHFTEFNTLSNGRLHSCNINRLYEVNGGHNSFHANHVYNVQNQVKTGGGIAVRANGITAPAYLYNQMWLENYFGGEGCKAFQLTNTNTDNVWGNLTHESALICETTDASVFEFKGNFSGIGTVSFNVATPTTIKAANFVFNNLLDNYAPFNHPALSEYNPALFNPQLADTMDNGVSASLWRIRNTLGYGLLLNSYNGSPGWKFTTTEFGQRLQDAKPKYSFGVDGNSFTGYASTLFINPANSKYGVLLSSDNACLAPRTDNTLSNGTVTYRWRQVCAVNSTIATSNKDKKTNIRQISHTEIDAFYEIAMLNSVWQWLERYQSESDGARLHSGPTVQDAITIMDKHGLDWRCYSAFCYDKWEAQEELVEHWDDIWITTPATEEVRDDQGNLLKGGTPEQRQLLVPAGSKVVREAREAGEDYGFRKEELLFWISRAVVSKQVELSERVAALESARK